MSSTEESPCSNCVPSYEKKALYLILTLPMFALYGAVAYILWHRGLIFFMIYCVFFVLVALFQAMVCVYWKCPYVGRFAPCVGGFCLPSSQLARLFKNLKMSEKTYNIVVTLAFVNFSGIILFPLYFLFTISLVYFFSYISVVAVYAVLFLLNICPVCRTREVCPGGQSAMALRKKLFKEG